MPRPPAALGLLLLLLWPAAAAAAPPADVRLTRAWQYWHPGETPPPACPHADPVTTLSADLDPTPGRETVLASRRLGVALLGRNGRLLAWRELGCADHRYANDQQDFLRLRAIRASGLAVRDLAVHTRDFGHCGTTGQLTLLRRQAANLVPMLELDDEQHLLCGSSDDLDARAELIVERPGRIRVQHTGTVSAWQPDGTYGPPVPTSSTTHYELRDSIFVVEDLNGAP